MTNLPPTVRFSQLFDRALAACANAQALTQRSTEAVVHARAVRGSARRMRLLAADTREAWGSADRALSLMQRQVEKVAIRMRAAGMDREAASAAMRAHVRFVLYDGGLREEEAEPLVEQTSRWVDLLFEAA